MTDRIQGFTVVLEKDMREDDVQSLVDAVRCLRGVAHVEKSVSTSAEWIAQQRERTRVAGLLNEFISVELFGHRREP